MAATKLEGSRRDETAPTNPLTPASGPPTAGPAGPDVPGQQSDPARPPRQTWQGGSTQSPFDAPQGPGGPAAQRPFIANLMHNRRSAPGEYTGSAGHPPTGPQPPWGAVGGDPYAFGAHSSGPQPGMGGHGAGGYGGGDSGFGPPPESASGLPAPQPGHGGRRGRGRVLIVAAVTALVTSLIVGPAATLITMEFAPGLGGRPLSSLTDGQASSVSTGSVSEVADKTLPSVVSIQAGQGTGSGVVISSDGQILTNAHVVAQAEGDTTRVRFHDSEEADAEVVGADPVSDLAVLQAEGQNDLTPAVFGDSEKVEVGADVVAIGSPLGLTGTVTSGVVSALDRPVNTGVVEQERPEQEGQQQPDFPFQPPEEPESQPQAQTSTVINAIQTDAPINPGNSGGPLMNMNGEVVGINTAIAGTGGAAGEVGSIGLGFAIPINQAQPIAEQLLEDGRANYAAIDATITATADGGVELVEVSGEGAAGEAGLQEGDIITSVNDEEVTNPDELIATVRSHQPGETVTIGYERGGNSAETELTLSAQSAESIGE
ncbi:S1C family serine protease [Allosalinactinospora lopnorensis]|uniref:S1C family serine protease n=1 Tax=Allosalinactinospora lopnorensis TaxID=1352348 RepID=UPI0006966228|nr:trypsin-like peptidase domain-containing protein [Allosalinactinospora lopnorensis]